LREKERNKNEKLILLWFVKSINHPWLKRKKKKVGGVVVGVRME
jgi:hypothetical protein